MPKYSVCKNPVCFQEQQRLQINDQFWEPDLQARCAAPGVRMQAGALHQSYACKQVRCTSRTHVKQVRCTRRPNGSTIPGGWGWTVGRHQWFHFHKLTSMRPSGMLMIFSWSSALLKTLFMIIYCQRLPRIRYFY